MRGREAGSVRRKFTPPMMMLLLLYWGCGLLVLSLGGAVHGAIVDCARTWPQLELFMPLNIMARPPRRLNRNHEPIHFFLRSFLYFWPVRHSNTSIVFVVDAERTHVKEYAEFQKLVRAHIEPMAAKPVVSFKINYPTLFHNQSYDRQQFIKFYADNYTSSEFVGFVDSDSVFSVYVDREDIFEYGNESKTALPVVNGRTGYNGYSLSEKWSPEHEWPWSTYQFLGLYEPVRCMSYFPIVFRVDHIKELRDYVSSRVSSASTSYVRGTNCQPTL
jgi:hypothetical protein